MMRNQRVELHEMIQNMGTQPGFDGVRIFNKMGTIMYSTDNLEIGQGVDKQAEACCAVTRPQSAADARPTRSRPHLRVARWTPHAGV